MKEYVPHIIFTFVVLLAAIGCQATGTFTAQQVCKPAGLEDWAIKERGLRVYYTKKGLPIVFDRVSRTVRFTDARTGEPAVMSIDSYVCVPIEEIPTTPEGGTGNVRQMSLPSGNEKKGMRNE